MTPTDNEKLARFCWWRLARRLHGRRFGPRKIGYRYERAGEVTTIASKQCNAHLYLPDYLNNLNLIREAELEMESRGARELYVRNLWGMLPPHNRQTFEVLTASPLLRAEALLKTISQLDEFKPTQS